MAAFLQLCGEVHLIGAGGETLLLLGGVQVDADLQRLFSASAGCSCSCLLWLLLLLLLSPVDSLSLLSWSRMSLVLVALLVTSSLLLLPLSRVSSVAGEGGWLPAPVCTKPQVPMEMGTGSRVLHMGGSPVPPLPPLLHQGAFLPPHLFHRACLCRTLVSPAWVSLVWVTEI